MTYTDELCAANPQHEAKYYLRTAVNREGKMIAHELRAYQNGGAYVAMRPNPPSQARQGAHVPRRLQHPERPLRGL